MTRRDKLSGGVESFVAGEGIAPPILCLSLPTDDGLRLAAQSEGGRRDYEEPYFSGIAILIFNRQPKNSTSITLLKLSDPATLFFDVYCFCAVKQRTNYVQD